MIKSERRVAQKGGVLRQDQGCRISSGSKSARTAADTIGNESVVSRDPMRTMCLLLVAAAHVPDDPGFHAQSQTPLH